MRYLFAALNVTGRNFAQTCAITTNAMRRGRMSHEKRVKAGDRA